MEDITWKYGIQYVPTGCKVPPTPNSLRILSCDNELGLLSLTTKQEIPQERLPVPLDLSFDTLLSEFCRSDDCDDGGMERKMNINILLISL